MYFAKNEEEYPIYKKIAGVLRSMDCGQIGLKAGGAWEYPLWMLMDWPRNPVRIEHVRMTNQSSAISYPRGDFHPCALLVETSGDMPKMLVEGGRPYIRTGGSWILTVYMDAKWLRQRSKE